MFVNVVDDLVMRCGGPMGGAFGTEIFRPKDSALYLTLCCWGVGVIKFRHRRKWRGWFRQKLWLSEHVVTLAGGDVN